MKDIYRIVNRRKRVLTRIVDVVGAIVFAPRRLCRPRAMPEPRAVSRILVIRTAYVGDVVMALPLLKPLRQRFPQAQISFLTAASAAPLLDHNPDVDEVITYDPFWFYPSSPRRAYFDYRRRMRDRTFDLVIETRGDIREILMLMWPLKARCRVSYGAGGGGWLLTHVAPYDGPRHRVEYHLNLARYLGASVSKVEWGLCLTDQERRRAAEFLAEVRLAKPFVCVHPGGRAPLKRWSGERWAELCDRIRADLRMPVALLGTNEECDLVARISSQMKREAVMLAGRLSLRELAAVLGEAALMVCHDSAPMHLAAAMNTPTVAIFGPSKSPETGPFGNQHAVVEKAVPCRVTCDENRCRNRDFHVCMRGITPDDVWRAVREMAGCCAFGERTGGQA